MTSGSPNQSAQSVLLNIAEIVSNVRNQCSIEYFSGAFSNRNAGIVSAHFVTNLIGDLCRFCAVWIAHACAAQVSLSSSLLAHQCLHTNVCPMLLLSTHIVPFPRGACIILEISHQPFPTHENVNPHSTTWVSSVAGAHRGHTHIGVIVSTPSSHARGWAMVRNHASLVELCVQHSLNL